MAHDTKQLTSAPTVPDNWAELIAGAGTSEVWAERLIDWGRTWPLAVRQALLSPEERLAALPPEERLADLTPAERVLVLPDELLRRLPLAFIDALPASVQERIHRRLSGC
ncbi:hypothetical protein [Haliangium sp.]|uniref:hypothetical protein n=1 Tax=Haliangium sp. TaxID=2663208 RepID=UPI003D106D7D